MQKQSGFFAQYGSLMHLILQMYLSGILAPEALPSFYLRHFAANVRAKPPSSAVYRNYFEQGLAYCESMTIHSRKIIGVEQNIGFSFAGKSWTGFLDVISEENGALIITDHKSRTLKPRSNRKKPTKSDEELDLYLRQLYVYAAAVRERYGRFPDLLEFNCFRSGQLICEPFDPDRYTQVETWAREQIEAITTNDNWSAEPDFWRCNYLCDVCSACECRFR